MMYGTGIAPRRRMYVNAQRVLQSTVTNSVSRSGVAPSATDDRGVSPQPTAVPPGRGGSASVGGHGNRSGRG